MKRQSLTLIIFLSTHFCTFGQTNYLEDGNSYLNSGKFEKAEQIFREGIKNEPQNLIYQCQLGLTLIKLEKYDEAQTTLNNVLEQDSNQVAAIWYGGIGNYKAGNDRKAIKFFEKALTVLDKTSGQYYSANWYIGKSYSILLKTEGLTYNETDRMFECYEEYLRLQPNAGDANQIREYLERKKERRPPNNVKIWIDI